jgi:hypothetical protein
VIADPQGETDAPPQCDVFLVSVLLDPLAHLPEVGFSLPLPRHPRLLALCAELIE